MNTKRIVYLAKLAVKMFATIFLLYASEVSVGMHSNKSLLLPESTGECER